MREGSGEEVEGTRRWAVSGAAVVSSFAPGRHPVSKWQSRDEGHCGRGGKNPQFKIRVIKFSKLPKPF